MPVGIFFSFPIMSVQNTLLPTIDRLGSTAYKMYYYDTMAFKPAGNFSFTFVAYPDSFKGYDERLNVNTSYFEFGEILLEAANNIIEQLIEEVVRIKPDFIIYSHLAMWGKLVAKHFNLPAITLNTTFILDKRIMLPHFRSINKSGSKLDTVSEAVAFYRKFESLHSMLGIKEQADPWDIYVNKGNLNIVFIFQEFQPQRHLFGHEYRFPVYSSTAIEQPLEKSVVYFSLGTVFNDNMHIFRQCIDTLKQLDLPSIVSAGYKVDIGSLIGEHDASHVKIVPFVNQKEVLGQSKLFISHGGMASVHEAMSFHTPMIIIPITPEQQITAQRIDELGIGRYILPENLTMENFRSAIDEMLSNNAQYIKKITAMSGGTSAGSPIFSAAEIIHEFLHTAQ